MSDAELILGRQLVAGRALAGLNREALAREAGVSLAALRRLEASEDLATQPAEKLTAVRKALEGFGIQFLGEGDAGAGVRLKFSRSEVERIATLEDEGGIVAEDDV